MSDIKRFGGLDGLKQPDWHISDNGYGLLEGSLKMFYNHNDKPISINIEKGSSHPFDSRLKAFDITINYGKNGVAYVDAKYIGIATGNVTQAEWSISGTTSDESIQFHPKFEKFLSSAIPPYTLGGTYPQTSVSKLTGVILDNDGNFQKFAPKHPTVPAIEQFVTPAATCECTFYTSDISIATFALKDNLGGTTSQIPYAPDFLTASGNKNWMLTSTSVTPHGVIYKCSWTFTLSVLDKVHNAYIYKDLGSGQSKN